MSDEFSDQKLSDFEHGFIDESEDKFSYADYIDYEELENANEKPCWPEKEPEEKPSTILTRFAEVILAICFVSNCLILWGTIILQFVYGLNLTMIGLAVLAMIITGIFGRAILYILAGR